MYKVDEQHRIPCNLIEDAKRKISQLKINKTTKGVLYEFADVFEERVGVFEGELDIEVEEDAVPVQQPIRSVPFAVEDAFKHELNRMRR